jgi:hypothetical protein
VENKLLELEKSRDYDSKCLDVVHNKQKKIDSMIKQIKSIEKEQSEKEAEWKAELTDLKSRSMRDNL